MPTPTPKYRPYYYPFGSSIKSRGYSAGSGFRFGFNGKENFDKYQDYGFRIYYSDLGKFLSTDPLIVFQQKYPELSSYQFASNMPICAIDLDGLEAKLAIAFVGGINTHYSSKDIISFRSRASKLKKIGFIPINGVNNGNSLVEKFKTATEKSGSISSIITFSHSDQSGILMDNDEGFYADDQKANPYSKNYSNVNTLFYAVKAGSVKFSVNACWLFGSCNTANNYFTVNPIALSVAQKLKISTIGATGSVYPEVIDNQETGALLTNGTFLKFTPVIITTKNGIIINRQSLDKTIPFTKKNIIGVSQKLEIKQTNLGNKIDPQKLMK